MAKKSAKKITEQIMIGSRWPGLKQLERLAQALGVPPDKLLK